MTDLENPIDPAAAKAEARRLAWDIETARRLFAGPV